MRMWMVQPHLMCDKHLLGEHVELHMLVGCIKRNKNISGFIMRRLVEPLSIFERHEQLANEMIRRGMKHKSPLQNIIFARLSTEELQTTVDPQISLDELYSRCLHCRARINANET